MAVQGIECVSWLLAERLHLGWATAVVEGAEGWQDVSTTRAHDWLTAKVGVCTERGKHTLRDVDLWVARQLRRFEERTGGDDGRGAALLDTLACRWRRLERTLQSYGSSIRQSPIKSMCSAVALMLAFEAGYCVLTVPPSTHGHGHGHDDGGGHGGDAAGFCAAEAGHHLVNIGLELTSAIIAGASTSDFVRARAKKAEYVRTQRREREREQKLLAAAIRRREARMHLDMSPEELEASKRRRKSWFASKKDIDHSA